MYYIKILICLLISFIILSCDDIQEYNIERKIYPNGIYLILETYKDSTFSATNNDILPFSHEFLDENKKGQPLYIKIDTTEFVELELQNEPIGIEQPDDRINLLLTLTESAKLKLAEFTEKNVKRNIGIIIENKAVTIHKIRSKIDEGKIQITRCTDNACEYLLLELKENIKK